MELGPDPSVTTWMLCMSPRPRTEPTGRHWWRELVTSSWRHAYDQWLIQRDLEASGYRTETRDYGRDNPCPRLSDFMVHLSSGALDPERALR